MKKVVIIGGGISGLTAGIFAQMNGFKSVILEKHHLLGGECTGWDRQGFHIDGCIHWLVGTKEGTPIHQLWKTVGALDGVEIYHPESFMTIESQGITVNFYRDLDRLQSSWLEISPEDAPAIHSFCQTIRKLQSFEIPVGKPMDLMNPLEKIRLLLSLKDAGMVMQKYGKISLDEYARSFKHPALRQALASFLPAGYSASSVFFSLATFTKGQASVPYGGSLALAQRMAEKYQSLGGQIKPRTEVTMLQIEDGRVSQALCTQGEPVSGDYFIAACDAHLVFEKLLKGQYPDPAYQERFANSQDYPLASEVRVALGYEGDLNQIPRTLRFPVGGFRVGQSQVEYLTTTHYQHEPGFAPQGQTVLTCSINQFHSDYDYWNSLDPEAYRQEKARIGDEVLKAILSRFPQMQGGLRVLDVVTPKTFERYCNAYRGSFMAFLPTIRGKSLAHTGKIRGLKNFHLSGQWLQPPGGLPVAVLTGKDTIMRLCKEEKRAFRDR